MGCATSKRYADLREESKIMRAKIHELEGKIEEMRRERVQEARAQERREAEFAAREGEWRRERRRHREEVSGLKKKLEEEEEAAAGGGVNKVELQRVNACRLVEQMKVEQARREEAVEKWKQLYMVIKNELDDLILRTKQGERLCWGKNVIEGLQGELKAKEEMVEALRSHLAAIEMEGAKRDREIDILRQSLRILSSMKAKKNRVKKNLLRILRS